MCGLYWELLLRGPPATFRIHADKQLAECLSCRGPDLCKSTAVSSSNSERDMLFHATVLWMQGDAATSQPSETDYGILLYNGDIFDTRWNRSVSDTSQIMDKLSQKNDYTVNNRVQHIVYVITKLRGPYSIVYYDKLFHILFFCRDIIGRNSLLFYNDENSIIICSVLGRKYNGVVEVPASHLYALSLEDLTISNYDRNSLEITETTSLKHWLLNLQEKQSLPDDNVFSNEITEETNPGFEDENLITFIENVAKNTKCRKEVMRNLLQNKRLYTIVNELINLLKESVKIRLETQPGRCRECIHAEKDCKGHCTAGVLFSGGLDCSILALLADEFLPKDQSIDLMNVAFKRATGTFDVPDRLTGKLALQELKTLRPLRKWCFREVNVSEDELRAEQRKIIADLVYPRQTVLDESLGSALWFAARAEDETTTSSCRVLLLGSGADELFGGYTRHRNALRRKSWIGLKNELLLDWRRISYRNLARDNRVISHHGRQPRLPYLDESFTEYVLKLNPWERCVPSDVCEQGLGDKLILRLVAFHLGLHNVSTLPKRALQFGSRIANKKENGADLSERFRNL